MTESFAPANTAGVELCYETFGDPDDPAILLVMGLATQMIAWDEGFCELLVDRGFFVVRYDNRDVGRSTRMEGAPPTVKQMLLRDKSAAAYSLSDMAADGVSLLDHLGIERAHVVGASMGGMIAQIIAIEHSDRVLSLTSIMSNAGGRLRGQPTLKVYPALLKRAPEELEAYAAHTVAVYDLIGSPGYERDPEVTRERARLAHARGVSPAGNGRQLAAILATDPRLPELRKLRVPTLVVHGTKDRLVRKSGGREVARAVPDALLLEIDGMGHDLPQGVWAKIADGILANAARATSRERSPAPR